MTDRPTTTHHCSSCDEETQHEIRQGESWEPEVRVCTACGQWDEGDEERLRRYKRNREVQKNEQPGRKETHHHAKPERRE